ncbi:MAG: hypothetical protein ACYCV4_05415 [Dermatophilaceae bacterium]
MARQDVDIDRGRPCLVGRAHWQPGSVEVGPCERDGKPVWGSSWQKAKVDEITARYDPLPVVAGGKKRPRIALLCWECARDLGIKMRAVPLVNGGTSYVTAE